MYRERIKSFVLGVLVILSALLTLNMWNYQPEFTRTDTNQVTQTTIIHEKVDESVLLSPTSVVVHRADGIFESTAEGAVSNLFAQVRDWEIAEFDQGTIRKKIAEWLGEEGNIELLFSGPIPLTDFQRLLRNESLDTSDLAFDRILIQKKADKTGRVYFISSKERQFVSGVVSTNAIKRFQGESKELNSTYYSVERLTSKDSEPIVYTRNSATSLPSLQYYIQVSEIEEYQNILFADLTSVKKVTKGNVETLTDGSSLMNIYLDTSTFSFVKPKIGWPAVREQLDYVNRAVAFINSHGGWDRRYRYEHFDAETGESCFRLQIEGVPIFNADGMSEITLTMGADEVRAYSAPYFSLDFLVKNEKPFIRELPSGIEVLKELKKQEDFDLKRLSRLQIGYKLSFDQQARYFVNLEPAWFYQYEQNWIEVQLWDEVSDDGLE